MSYSNIVCLIAAFLFTFGFGRKCGITKSKEDFPFWMFLGYFLLIGFAISGGLYGVIE